jgi:hypothetical protein
VPDARGSRSSSLQALKSSGSAFAGCGYASHVKAGPEHQGEYYAKTPFIKRLPTVLSLAVSFAVARILVDTWWTGVLVFLATFVLCILILRFVFRLPLDRLLSYKEFD